MNKKEEKEENKKKRKKETEKEIEIRIEEEEDIRINTHQQLFNEEEDKRLKIFNKYQKLDKIYHVKLLINEKKKNYLKKKVKKK
jgi:hypothetical protein